MTNSTSRRRRACWRRVAAVTGPADRQAPPGTDVAWPGRRRGHRPAGRGRRSGRLERAAPGGSGTGAHVAASAHWDTVSGTDRATLTSIRVRYAPRPGDRREGAGPGGPGRDRLPVPGHRLVRAPSIVGGWTATYHDSSVLVPGGYVHPGGQRAQLPDHVGREGADQRPGPVRRRHARGSRVAPRSRNIPDTSARKVLVSVPVRGSAGYGRGSGWPPGLAEPDHGRRESPGDGPSPVRNGYARGSEAGSPGWPTVWRVCLGVRRVAPGPPKRGRSGRRPAETGVAGMGCWSREWDSCRLRCTVT